MSVAAPGRVLPGERAVLVLARVCAVISALAVVAIMVAIALQVVVRALWGFTLPGMLEVAQSCLVIAVAFGLGWAAVTGDHVSVTLLTDRLSVRVNRVLDVVVWSVSAVLVAWLAYTSTTRALEATERGEQGFGIIVWYEWPWRWFVAVGFVVLLLVCVMNVARSLTGARPYDQVDRDDESVADPRAQRQQR
ncbi:TRAP transporter small permease [uncultured Serinicoccus sp.]|uniref:TRAP transporter small permease n=1 Tax=uncultured Serinicoccus sp. TaxID=735514 RepID=UPI002602D365|nr:TRAP transporter small permease [uncultured Serinicoccus sp.]